MPAWLKCCARTSGVRRKCLSMLSAKKTSMGTYATNCAKQTEIGVRRPWRGSLGLHRNPDDATVHQHR